MTTATPSKQALWAGRVASTIPILVLILSASAKIAQRSGAQDALSRFGYAASQLPAIGILELICTAAYLVLRTAMLGAIRLTGYLGRAIATHVRIHDAFFVPLLLGVMVWAGLWLREPRLRIWLPTRS